MFRLLLKIMKKKFYFMAGYKIQKSIHFHLIYFLFTNIKKYKNKRMYISINALILIQKVKLLKIMILFLRIINVKIKIFYWKIILQNFFK